jgi:hypothetical protein
MLDSMEKEIVSEPGDLIQIDTPDARPLPRYNFKISRNPITPVPNNNY